MGSASAKPFLYSTGQASSIAATSKMPRPSSHISDLRKTKAQQLQKLEIIYDEKDGESSQNEVLPALIQKKIMKILRKLRFLASLSNRHNNNNNNVDGVDVDDEDYDFNNSTEIVKDVSSMNGTGFSTNETFEELKRMEFLTEEVVPYTNTQTQVTLPNIFGAIVNFASRMIFTPFHTTNLNQYVVPKEKC